MTQAELEALLNATLMPVLNGRGSVQGSVDALSADATLAGPASAAPD